MAENSRQPTVESLVSAGDYVGAARLATAEGNTRRAIELFERVWMFREALDLAVQLGDTLLAIRLALEAKALGTLRQLVRKLDARDPEQVRRAAAMLGNYGQCELAATLLARVREYTQAAQLYQRAGLLLASGRMLERAGQWQEAGRLYEALARVSQRGSPPGSERAQAALALGRLLGQVGQHQQAARALQLAAGSAKRAVRRAAWRALQSELQALGFHHAAAALAGRLQNQDVWERISAVGAAQAPRARSIPSIPPRFQVLDTLGTGALGRVFLAFDRLWGRRVALKALSAGLGGSACEDQAFFRFVREAEAVGRVNHPNVVRIYEFLRSDGILVMEHMRGGTLYQLLGREPTLSPAAARRMALELLAGLQEAHHQGVIHRDVKPANILFDAAGTAKLGDFGAAHLLDFGQTQTGGFIGTLAYLSPEQVSGSAVSAATDLYALGAVLFEALTGRPPFLGPDLVAQHLAEEPPLASSLRAGLSPQHDQVLRHALAKAPAARYASAQEMADAVRAWPGDTVPGLARSREVDEHSSPPARPESSADVPEPLLLGSTGSGRLFALVDPHTRRRVLREERDQALSAEAVDHLRLLAAQGGPYVQRVLALEEDLKGITYERLEGRECALSEISPEERAMLDPVWAGLAPLGVAPRPDLRVVLTAEGPVVLVSPVISKPAP